MDSYFPNVEMVLVDDVNDIVDPLDTVEMDADTPAIKLELDDNIESDDEFRLNQNESYETKETDEWIKREEKMSSDLATAEPILENDDWPLDNYDDDDNVDEDDTQSTCSKSPDEQNPIIVETKELQKIEAVYGGAESTIEKIKVSPLCSNWKWFLKKKLSNE